MTAPKADPRAMHKLVGALINKQVRALRRKMKSHGALSDDDVKQLKQLADAIDRQVRTQRLLDEDEDDAAKTMTDEELEQVAGGKTPHKQNKPSPKQARIKRQRTETEPDDDDAQPA